MTHEIVFKAFHCCFHVMQNACVLLILQRTEHEFEQLCRSQGRGEMRLDEWDRTGYIHTCILKIIPQERYGVSCALGDYLDPLLPLATH